MLLLYLFGIYGMDYTYVDQLHIMLVFVGPVGLVVGR
jgi:hypothetical protein